jgi:phosphatidylinositol alpha 1,6-mannosyltransferase
LREGGACPFSASAPESAHRPSSRRAAWTLELPRGFLSFALEKDLRFDPAFLRHIPLIGEVLERFQPDLIHITGPSEVGMLGAGLAHHLGLPLAASWHTNVHEYAARRSGWFLRLLPKRQSAATGQKIEDLALARGGPVLLRGARPVCAQPGAVRAAGARHGPELPPDAARRRCRALPSRQTQAAARGPRFILGFVGRLSVEKNVALLARFSRSWSGWG